MKKIFFVAILFLSLLYGFILEANLIPVKGKQINKQPTQQIITQTTKQIPVNNSLKSFNYSTQTINFVTGWNSFSTYLLPRYMSMTSIVQSLLDEGSLIAIDDKEGHTITVSETGFVNNNIYNISIGHGYRIKVNKQTSLTIEGTPLPLPHNLQLHSGWNTIGYIGNTGASVLCVLKPLIDSGNFTMLKDENGKVFWLYGTGENGLIDSIGTMQAGEGYQILVNNPQILTFKSNYGTCSLAPDPIIPSYDSQTLILQTGRNIVGINIIPNNPDPEYMFSGLFDGLFIIKNANGQAFVSDLNSGLGVINMLGNIQVGVGYKIYVSHPVSITITGSFINLPYNVALQTGRNWVSFNAENSSDVACARGNKINQFNGPIINILDVNNNFMIYVPGIGIHNSIGNLQKGSIYKIYTNQATNVSIEDSYNCN